MVNGEYLRFAKIQPALTINFCIYHYYIGIKPCFFCGLSSRLLFELSRAIDK